MARRTETLDEKTVREAFQQRLWTCLRKAREQVPHLSHTKLAEKLGVNRSFFGKVERGESGISFYLFIQWCELLNQTVDQILKPQRVFVEKWGVREERVVYRASAGEWDSRPSGQEEANCLNFRHTQKESPVPSHQRNSSQGGAADDKGGRAGTTQNQSKPPSSAQQ